jgi:hypothetical protein
MDGENTKRIQHTTAKVTNANKITGLLGIVRDLIDVGIYMAHMSCLPFCHLLFRSELYAGSARSTSNNVKYNSTRRFWPMNNFETQLLHKN